MSIFDTEIKSSEWWKTFFAIRKELKRFFIARDGSVNPRPSSEWDFSSAIMTYEGEPLTYDGEVLWYYDSE